MVNKRKKKVLVILIVVSLILICTGNYISSLAASSSELRQQQQQNKQSIKETEAEQEKIRSQMTSIQKEVEELNSQILSYESEISDLSNKIDEATKSIDTMQIELNKKQKELEEKQELLEKRLVASYKAGNTSYLDVLLSSESLTSFLSNYYLIEQLAESDTKLIETIKESKNIIEASKTALEESKKELEVAKETQESKKAALDIAKSEKSARVAELSEEDRALEEKIEKMQEEDSKIMAAIKAAEAAEKQNSNQGNNGSGSSAPGKVPGGFALPVPSGYTLVTAGWYYSSGRLHGATDFGAGGINGQPVYASKSGTVMLVAYQDGGYGNYIMINHHDGTYTLYAHGQNGSVCVSEGQTVSQGQQIMRVGSTGNSTGPHLHFEIRLAPGGSSNRVNPLNYLPL
ncbi:MAG: peptidoglycan DD-metalloendopeptidase family protein [Clostridia bacterium]|nr:peptidoglycan DD-metalloendopeptidase family protein [Clostridia bacterium]